MTETATVKAKARVGGTGRIVVDDCPFCHKTHYHMLPEGDGQRLADCFRGEYILDFTDEPDEPAQPAHD